jgi:hypothetical protein
MYEAGAHAMHIDRLAIVHVIRLSIISFQRRTNIDYMNGIVFRIRLKVGLRMVQKNSKIHNQTNYGQQAGRWASFRRLVIPSECPKSTSRQVGQRA